MLSRNSAILDLYWNLRAVLALRASSNDGLSTGWVPCASARKDLTLVAVFGASDTAAFAFSSGAAVKLAFSSASSTLGEAGGDAMKYCALDGASHEVMQHG